MADISAKALRELQGALDNRIGQKAPTTATTQTATVTGSKDGDLWVTLDGATTPTPASSSVCAVSVGDRVTTVTENGALTITGNVTAPATSQSAVDSTVAPVADTASEALTSAIEAFTAATTAKEAAEAATTDAATAKAKAEEAATDAATAKTKATEAASSASSAATSAKTAASDASAAKASAATAATSATNAEASASSAASDATTAKEAAEAATTDASTAGIAASRAQAAAEAAETASSEAKAKADSAASDASTASTKATEAAASAAKTATKIVTEYATGTSQTTAPTSRWSSKTPTYTAGTYTWMRNVVTYGNGSTATTSPVLVAGNTGAGFCWNLVSGTADATCFKSSEYDNTHQVLGNTSLKLGGHTSGESRKYWSYELKTPDLTGKTIMYSAYVYLDSLPDTFKYEHRILYTNSEGKKVWSSLDERYEYYLPKTPPTNEWVRLWCVCTIPDSAVDVRCTSNFSVNEECDFYYWVSSPMITETTTLTPWCTTQAETVGAKGDTGAPGTDGVSPTVTTSKSGDTTTIKITDASGTKTATITDGQDADIAAAEAATKAANDAASSASSAATSATSAASKATTATTNANTATSKANTATTNANAAAAAAAKVNATVSGTTLTVTDNTGKSTSVDTKGEKGDTGAQGIQGEKGETGAKGAKGDKGDTGADGVSPTATVTKSGTTTTITITDASGTTKQTVSDGAKGDKGDTGAQGEKGDKGDQGEPGTDGASVSTVAVQYATGTSQTTAPTSGWQSEVPELKEGSYVWIRSVTTITAADGTTTTDYGTPALYLALDGLASDVRTAQSTADTAKDTAESAQTAANDTREWFWHDSQGAHVCNGAKDGQSVSNSRFQTDITSTGLQVVDVQDAYAPVASFGVDSDGNASTQLGKSTEANVSIGASELEFMSSDTELARFYDKGVVFHSHDDDGQLCVDASFSVDGLKLKDMSGKPEYQARAALDWSGLAFQPSGHKPRVINHTVSVSDSRWKHEAAQTSDGFEFSLGIVGFKAENARTLDDDAKLWFYVNPWNSQFFPADSDGASVPVTSSTATVELVLFFPGSDGSPEAVYTRMPLDWTAGEQSVEVNRTLSDGVVCPWSDLLDKSTDRHYVRVREEYVSDSYSELSEVRLSGFFEFGLSWDDTVYAATDSEAFDLDVGVSQTIDARNSIGITAESYSNGEWFEDTDNPDWTEQKYRHAYIGASATDGVTLRSNDVGIALSAYNSPDGITLDADNSDAGVNIYGEMTVRNAEGGRELIRCYTSSAGNNVVSLGYDADKLELWNIYKPNASDTSLCEVLTSTYTIASSLASGGSATNTFTVSKSGYTPMGLIGFHFVGSTYANGAVGHAWLTDRSVGQGTIHVTVRNVASKANTIKGAFYVLWAESRE